MFVALIQVGHEGKHLVGGNALEVRSVKIHNSHRIFVCSERRSADAGTSPIDHRQPGSDPAVRERLNFD